MVIKGDEKEWLEQEQDCNAMNVGRYLLGA
jgi:hypothetical protein